MPAAVFADIGRLELVERPVPRLRRPGDVLLDVQSSGICGTDLHILSTPPGFEATPGTVLGHEFVGVVRETGADVTSLAPEDRVVVAPNISWGSVHGADVGFAITGRTSPATASSSTVA